MFSIDWFNCTNQIQQALQLFFDILNLFCASFKQLKLTCVWWIFRFIFRFVVPQLFLKWCLSLLLNMQDNEKTMKEQRVKRHRKTNKSYSIAKREFVRGYSKFRTLTPSSPLLRTPNFDLSRPHSWMSLIGIQNPSTLVNFGIFIENFNNQIKIVVYNFFIAHAYNSIYYSHMYNKTDRKVNSFSRSRLLREANVPLVFPLHNYKWSTK